MNSTIRSKPTRAAHLPERDRFGSPSVWFALLGGPVAWAAHLGVSYGLVYVPCSVQAPLLILTTLVAVLVTIAAAIVSWRRLQKSPATETDAPLGGRNRFVGIAGLITSFMFLAIILVQSTTPLALGNCG